jgi:hypothetical protein
MVSLHAILVLDRDPNIAEVASQIMAHFPDHRVQRYTILFLLLLVIAAARPAETAAIDLSGGKPATIPFTLIDNRIFVPVTINGRGPYQFIFDTGGANILDPAVAKDLSLKLDPDGEAWGAGADRQQAWRTEVARADLSGVAILDHEFRVVSLDAIRKAIGFRRLDGLVGRELFERFVVDIDYAGQTLTFAEPQSWRPPGTLGKPHALGFYAGIPTLPAAVGGLIGNFIVDTGDRSSLTLFGPFVDRHSLRAKYPKKVQAITGWGVGGPIPADVTRSTFAFAGHTLECTVTRMPLLKTGGFASNDAAGSIGTGVLKRFRATFDYSRKHLYLTPGVNYAAADPADRSGLWLSLDEAGFKVMSVVAGSPAAEGGVRVDDIVTAVDGTPASQTFLVDLRERLKSATPGTKVRLRLGTGMGTRDVTLTLRELI